MRILSGADIRMAMKRCFRSLFEEEQGQDLVEYSLIPAFIRLASAALFIGAGGNIFNIWTSANSFLSTGAVSSGT